MHARRKSVHVALLFAMLFAITCTASAAPRKHTVVLGAVKKVPYSKAGDPGGAPAGDVNNRYLLSVLVDEPS